MHDTSRFFSRWQLDRRLVLEVLGFLAAAAVVGVVFFGFLAWGQPAGEPVAAAGPGELEALLQRLFAAIVAGQWWPVASIVVSLATWATRSGAVKLLPGKVGAFFSHPVVSWCLPFVLALMGALVTSAGGGVPITAGLLAAEVAKVGAGAIAGYVGLRKLAEARGAGATAAAAVPDKAAALDVLRGPVP